MDDDVRKREINHRKNVSALDLAVMNLVLCVWIPKNLPTFLFVCRSSLLHKQ